MLRSVDPVVFALLLTALVSMVANTEKVFPDMPGPVRQLMRAMEKSLRFAYVAGGLKLPEEVREGHWRCLGHTWIGHCPRARAWLEFRNGRRPIPAGGAALASEFLPHRIEWPRPERAFPWAHVRFRVLGTVNLLSLVQYPKVLPPRAGRRVGKLLVGLADLRQTDSMPALAQRASLGFQLLELILEMSVIPEDAPQRLTHMQRILPVLEMIRERFADPLTRGSMARHLGLSESRFSDVFRKAMHVPPMFYLQRHRLQQAQTQLLTTTHPIHAICEAVGFHDAFHFSRLFKATYGLSPRHFRQRTLGTSGATTPGEAKQRT